MTTTNEKEAFKAKLRARLERMLKRWDDYPASILVADFSLAQEALIGYAPTEYFAHLKEQTHRRVRSRAGFCEDCGNDLKAEPDYANTKTLCLSCEAQYEKMATEAGM